jgi:phospho-N-acetylmuramoyl-pentapeptide-transferase
VIIQVYSYRSRRKRVFRMAPLHHHLQLSGWNEWAVALTGWTATLIAGSLTLLIVRKAA